MKKYMMIGCILLLILSACSSKEQKELKEYGITDTTSCENITVLKENEDGLIKDKGSVYCAIDENNQHLKQANHFVKAGYEAKRINEFFELPYYQDSLTDRYIAYDDGKMSVEDVVTYVNIGLDQPYFTNVDTIQKTDDIGMVINKYHKLPDGYEPSNLVRTPNACVIGKDYSCQSEPQYLVKEVADAFQKLVDAAKREDINIKAIASYRSYDYQKNLYDYYANTEGKEYADQYYARPGQSEHNSGLAVDVTLNDENFNEIEQSKDYSWLLDHMNDYGFILRYPEDKVSITGYEYESWHLRYVGTQVAKEIKEQGLTLDEYVARKVVE